jgi:hypothetical protein
MLRPKHKTIQPDGELLDAAEAAGFEVLITTDRNLRYQQDLAGRKIAVVALGQGPMERHRTARRADGRGR